MMMIMRQWGLIIGFGVMTLAALTWLTSEISQSTKGVSLNGKPGVLSIVAPDRVDVGRQFEVDIVMDSEGQAVNAVGAHLNYDQRKLEILRMDTSNSFCEFYPENKFDNSIGEIRISCGSPSPGFVGESVLAKLEILTKENGLAVIEVEPESQILLNDGKATNILTDFPTSEILIEVGI